MESPTPGGISGVGVGAVVDAGVEASVDVESGVGVPSGIGVTVGVGDGIGVGIGVGVGVRTAEKREPKNDPEKTRTLAIAIATTAIKAIIITRDFFRISSSLKTLDVLHI